MKHKDVKSGSYNFREKSDDKAPKKVQHVEIHRAENGGRIVHSHYGGPGIGMFSESKKHAFESHAKAMKHVNKVMGDEPEGGSKDTDKDIEKAEETQSTYVKD